MTRTQTTVHDSRKLRRNLYTTTADTLRCASLVLNIRTSSDGTLVMAAALSYSAVGRHSRHCLYRNSSFVNTLTMFNAPSTSHGCCHRHWPIHLASYVVRL